jgi:large conductance mechanosensitive channel
MLQGFKQFILRGNVLDLAVAVVMGVAFGAVVAALVKDLITPLIAAIVGKPDFSAIEFTINGSRFPIGDFINAVVSFILIAAAVYFLIVLPMNAVLAQMRRGEVSPDPTSKKCRECLSDVPIAARRCAFCTVAQEDRGRGGDALARVARRHRGRDASLRRRVSGDSSLSQLSPASRLRARCSINTDCFRTLHRHEPHRGPRYCLANRLGVGSIVGDAASD